MHPLRPLAALNTALLALQLAFAGAYTAALWWWGSVPPPTAATRADTLLLGVLAVFSVTDFAEIAVVRRDPRWRVVLAHHVGVFAMYALWHARVYPAFPWSAWPHIAFACAELNYLLRRVLRARILARRRLYKIDAAARLLLFPLLTALEARRTPTLWLLVLGLVYTVNTIVIFRKNYKSDSSSSAPHTPYSVSFATNAAAAAGASPTSDTSSSTASTRVRRRR